MEELIDYVAFLVDISSKYITIHDITIQYVEDFLTWIWNKEKELHSEKRIKDEKFALWKVWLLYTKNAISFYSKDIIFEKRIYDQLMMDKIIIMDDCTEDQLFELYKNDNKDCINILQSI